MKTLILVAATILAMPIRLVAQGAAGGSQASAPTLTQPEQTQLALAWATLENAQLKLQLTVSEIEKGHPNMHYDFQSRQLVPNMPQQPAKVEPLKK